MRASCRARRMHSPWLMVLNLALDFGLRDRGDLLFVVSKQATGDLFGRPIQVLPCLCRGSLTLQALICIGRTSDSYSSACYEHFPVPYSVI